MSEVSVNKRHLSLPWAVVFSAIVGIVSGCGVYYSLVGRLEAAHIDVRAAQTYTERVEKSQADRFNIVERRIERVEDANARVVLLLERIDERTLEMKRRMDTQPGH